MIRGPINSEKGQVLLDGFSLECETLNQLRYGNYSIDLTSEAWERVQRAREVVDDIVARDEVVYGVNTGFGNFSDVTISADKVHELQENLVRSHACGVGAPLTPEQTRCLLVLRINCLARGRSGISVETLRKVIDAFNADCLPFIPSKGTVGASGDLTPLAHLALGLLGEGEMWDVETKTWREANAVLRSKGLTPLHLAAKEGLCMINGTQMMTAVGVEALVRAINCVKTADVIAALTVESLRGTNTAFQHQIHAGRPHKGQMKSAMNLRAMLHRENNPSEIAVSHTHCGRVQDSYTLRCVPQVHGIVYDTLSFVKKILRTEINSATDNPMVFPENKDKKKMMSGGNFHGEYPAKVLDYLAIAIHEVSNVSERRIERLLNPDLSGLPAFLVKEGGLNSGLMLAQVLAAALVSENKTLCHPSSVDSISTSAAKEDHVSMGGWSARKALQVVENVEVVLAVEAIAAAQAIDFLRPYTTTEPLEKLHSLIRELVSPWDKDRYLKPDIDAVTSLIRSGKILERVRPMISSYVKEQKVLIKAAL